MRRQDRQSTALQVGADQAGDEFDRRRIECDVGLIEYPQRPPFVNQSRQRNAPFLPLREVAAGQFLASGEPDQLQRIKRGAFVEVFIGEMRRRQQVLQRRQLLLDGVVMAEVAQLAPIVLAERTDRFAAPANFTGRWMRKAAKNAQ